MQLRPFPRLGVAVPVCGFGAWAIGGRGYGPVDRAGARGALIRFLELGGTFIDTAEAYGASEEIIGDVLAELRCRDHVVLATKTQHHAPDEIRRALEQSLRRLRTERVDVYQIHLPPEDDVTMARVTGAFVELQTAGKARVIGASVKGAAVTPSTAALCRRYIETERVHALQVIYSVLRPGNAAIFREAAQAGVGIIARTVLESGFLTGAYPPGHGFPAGDHRHRWSRERLDPILRAVQQLAATLPAGIESPAELAIRFALTPPEVSVVIPGAKSAVQVERNWRAADRGPLSESVGTELRRRFAGLEELGNPG
jgi:aryl-alcohol dehydrogenase-like predicted oxidoreductase